MINFKVGDKIRLNENNVRVYFYIAPHETYIVKGIENDGENLMDLCSMDSNDSLGRNRDGYTYNQEDFYLVERPVQELSPVVVGQRYEFHDENGSPDNGTIAEVVAVTRDNMILIDLGDIDDGGSALLERSFFDQYYRIYVEPKKLRGYVRVYKTSGKLWLGKDVYDSLDEAQNIVANNIVDIIEIEWIEKPA